MIDNFLFSSEAFKSLLNDLKDNNVNNIRLTGVFGSSSAHLACSILYNKEYKGKKLVYVASNELAARDIFNDCCYFNRLFGGEENEILRLNPTEYMLYDVEARNTDASGSRVETLFRLLEGKWKILIVSPGSLMQWLPNPALLRKNRIDIRVGENYEIQSLADSFTGTGYLRVSQVDGRGQFSVRGDIVDIFPYNSEQPYRIEFFDTEIDSIRKFDVVSQRTVGNEDRFTILPDRETYIWNEDQALRVRTNIKMELVTLDPASSAAVRMASDVEKIEPFRTFAGYDRYLPYILENRWSVFDYTGKIPVFIEKEEALLSSVDSIADEHVRICDTIRESAGLPGLTPRLLMDSDTVQNILLSSCGTKLYIDEFGAESEDRTTTYGIGNIHFNVKSTDPWGGNTQMLTDGVKGWTQAGFNVYVFAESDGKGERLKELLGDQGVSSVTVSSDKLRSMPDVPGVAYIITGGISSGFVYPNEKVAVVCDKALFKREKARAKRKLKGSAITSFVDLHPGDYVVHDVHGIGQFQQVESIVIDEVRQDYLKILYKDSGVLFVPVHQLDSVQKYIGGDGAVPQLNKLGSAEWNRTTAKVKAGLRTYAKELVELYAKRSRMQGFSFSKDTVWQTEFEAAFPYDETEDQLRCVEEIKADMESPKPMERLLCGDVGYGKTEVALRACFKAVLDGKQVAFLVPTTVLAQQHYQNFVTRFADFPVTVDYLCRFRTAGEKKKVLEGLEKGTVDIVVGTHSLIKQAVKFKNLGLAVIDEEQRFGVKHKDKFKSDHPEIDILSLSATPIPRTLHMSLSGIRDISVLEDPPSDRLPVQTYVAEWDEALIRNAIYREMARHGQVFYLVNRIKAMDERVKAVRELVPEARIAVAHGQMGENELEDIMNGFYHGEYDVLLCTTIIESGLDMPNVNTIIVEDSDRMGLSQLYQIRGRVGRSSRLAYAYITYKKSKELTDIAEKRLRTIRDFTEFGSGFKIALRDLEIRGAGSVLGERQHGQMSVVGYETYCKLLNDVILEEQGKPAEQRGGIASVEFHINAYISADFIEDEEARLDVYRKIAHVDTEDDALEMQDELIDRYGSVPKSITYLIMISRIRHAAERLGFSSVIRKASCIHIVLGAGLGFMKQIDTKSDAYYRFTGKYGRKLAVNLNHSSPHIQYFFRAETDNDALLKETLEFLNDIYKLKDKG